LWELKEGSKKAIIVVDLFEQSRRVRNEQIEKEISKEPSRGLPKIPWMKKVEGVKVESASARAVFSFECKHSSRLLHHPQSLKEKLWQKKRVTKVSLHVSLRGDPEPVIATAVATLRRRRYRYENP